VAESDPFVELLREIQPQLQRLFQRFRIPAEVAERLLEDTVMVMLYRRDDLVRPDRWLIRTLRFACLRHCRDQRRRLCLAADKEIRRWIDDDQVSDEEKVRRKLLLSRRIDRLPARCRPLLRHTYHLALVSGEGLPHRFSPRPLHSGLGPMRPEDPHIRCLSLLMRHLVEDRLPGVRL
jgi:DNA-directed RNA polymerase specialized sigma24 family protein